MSHTYPYPRPALTVDLVLITTDAVPEVLLIRRGAVPFAGSWALPGGFVNENEPLDAAARRELLEETGVTVTGELRQVGTFGDPGRDPRGWTVSVAYVARVEKSAAAGGDDAAEARWWPLDALPGLAFDHGAIVATAQAGLSEPEA